MVIRDAAIRVWPIILLSALLSCGNTLAQDVNAAPPSASNRPEADLVAEGRAAIASKDYNRAVALLTTAAGQGNAEAQELLGLARERAGQLAQARLAYETYLKAFPNGDGTERVRQRLSGVMVAIESEAAAELAARRKVNLDTKGQATTITTKPPRRLPVSAPGKGDFASAATEEKGWHWQTTGSAGQFYYRNDGYTGAQLRRGTFDDHDVLQNDLVSSADITLRGENGPNEIKVRIAGYEQTNLESSWNSGDTSLSAAYVDMRNRLNGLSARVGRQTRYDGGVFGRFDGVLLGDQVSDQILLQVVAGSPVYYGEVEPFADDRAFLGASIDLTPQNKAWTGTLYAIGQNSGGVVDRRAVGASLRYGKHDVTGYANADYDVYYGEFNSATMSGNWDVTDDFSLFGSVDYRHVPFLLTSNALAGQSATSLASLADMLGMNDVEALALDRTASARTVTGGFSYEFAPDWQFTLDATVADYSGTPASGGVDAIPDPGIEYYVSAMVSGTGVFRDNDYAGLALMLIDNSDYRTVMTDLTYRFAVTEDLRLAPRLRLAYRDAGAPSCDQILIMPSLGLQYQVTDHWSFESEMALRWEDNRDAAGSGQNVELLMTAGYRYQF